MKKNFENAAKAARKSVMVAGTAKCENKNTVNALNKIEASKTSMNISSNITGELKDPSVNVSEEDSFEMNPEINFMGISFKMPVKGHYRNSTSTNADTYKVIADKYMECSKLEHDQWKDQWNEFKSSMAQLVAAAPYMAEQVVKVMKTMDDYNFERDKKYSELRMAEEKHLSEMRKAEAEAANKVMPDEFVKAFRTMFASARRTKKSLTEWLGEEFPAYSNELDAQNLINATLQEIEFGEEVHPEVVEKLKKCKLLSKKK